MTDLDVRPAPASTPGKSASHTRMIAAAATLAGAAVVALATLVQLWFAPFVAGLALGGLAAMRGLPARTAALSAAAATLAGWAAPLIARSIGGEPVVAAAGVTAALAGLPPHGWIIVVVTLVVAVGQGLLGVWLSCSIGALFRPSAR